MWKWIVLGLLALSWIRSARAEVKLFAQYDWKDGAKDVAGAAIRHDGVLDPRASIVDGKLVVDRWDGVLLGHVPELDGASEVLFRFENVTFTKFGEPGPGAVGDYTILAGDGMRWWVGAYFTSWDGEKTRLAFDLGGYGSGARLEVDIANALLTHFDSIDFRLNGNAPLDQRFGIRWNDGPWVIGGVGDDTATSIPVTREFRINNGNQADWDPMWGSMGTISMYSNVIVPEPAASAIVAVVGIGLMRRWRVQSMRARLYRLD